jgi:dynactin 1
LSQNAGEDTRLTGATRRPSSFSAAPEVPLQPYQQPDQTAEPTSTTNRFVDRLARTNTASGRPVPLATSRSGRNLASIASASDTALTSAESYADSSPTPSLDGTPTPAPRNASKDGVFKKPTALTSAIHANRTGPGSVATDNATQRERAQTREQPPRTVLTRPTSTAPSLTNDGPTSRSRAASVISRASSRMSDVPDAFDGPDESRKPPLGGTGKMPLGTSRRTVGAPEQTVSSAGAKVGYDGSNASTIIRESSSIISRLARAESTLPHPIDDRIDHDALAKARATTRELEEIKIRLKLMENRRSEDAERIMALEARAMEAETKAQNFDKLRSRSEILRI